MYRFVVNGDMPTPSKKMKKNDPSYRRRGSKRYPCERLQTYTIAENGTVLVDVAKTLCGQNHRLYRQSKMYHVKLSWTDVSDQRANQIYKALQIWTLPDTWYLKKAWELGFSAVEEQWAHSSRKRGRWQDFRVGWSSSLKTGTIGVHGDLGSIGQDEYSLTKIHDATASNDYEFVVFGTARDTANNLYGLIEQYDQTGNTIGDAPDNATADAYANTKADVGLVEAAGDSKLTDSDDAPYDMDSFNGADDGGSVYQPTLSVTEDGVGRMSCSFWAPLGLIKVTNVGLQTSFQISVSPGNYKGVKAIDF